MRMRRYWLSLEDEHGGVLPPQPLEQMTSQRLVLVAGEVALELAGRRDLGGLDDLVVAAESIYAAVKMRRREELTAVTDGR